MINMLTVFSLKSFAFWGVFFTSLFTEVKKAKDYCIRIKDYIIPTKNIKKT